MGFIGSASEIVARAMPFRALLKHDLKILCSSWLVRLWLVAAGAMTLLILAPGWAKLQSAPLIASLLFPFLVFPWFLVVLVLGISPVTGSRAEELADGILCRPVTRLEYLLAAWAARVAVVLGTYLIVIVPAALLVTFAKRPAYQDDVTFYGLVSALAVVGLVLTFQVTFGFLLGTLLRSLLLSAVVVVLVWIPINLVLTTFSLEEFSPISLTQALPTLLRTHWQAKEGEAATEAAAQLDNLDAMGQQFLATLSGTSPPPRREQEPEFYDQSKFKDFSPPRVVLGYGSSTLLAMFLAALSFCLRDF